MKFRGIGRLSMALAASIALGLGMTACGGGTVGYMWVAGIVDSSTGASQVVGFKIDNYTGNLTRSPLSPYTSGGSNPANILVRPGGRFVYVVNTGTTAGVDPVTGKPISNHDGNIAEFTVGGDGRLVFQHFFQTQGLTPIWASMDTSGNFLYALDSLAPADSTYGQAGMGDITVFQIDPNTGRLSLVQNQQIKDASGQATNFFPVGPSPVMTKVSNSGCLFVVDKLQSSDLYATAIFPYTVTSGQLIQPVNTQIQTGATHLSSINVGGGNGTGTSTGGAYVYATDIGPQSTDGTATTAGQIYAYTVGSNCSLNAVTSSPFANLAPGQNPVWAQSVTGANGANFVYVLNQSTTNSSQQNSPVSILTVDTSGKLTAAPLGTNPVATGAGPTCMAEDPTNQYLYTSNSIDGTLTGKRLDAQNGDLNDLPRNSRFTAVTHASCLAISNAVD